MVPVHDHFNYTKDHDEVILAFNERIHLASWDMEADNMYAFIYLIDWKHLS